MIKRILLLVSILILVLASPAYADEADQGTIDGQLVNGTAGGTSSLAGLDVSLSVYLDEVEMDGLNTVTDADGKFVFSGLSTEPGYRYQAVADFQGVEYTSLPIVFLEGEASAAADIIVYETTTSDEAVMVMMSHMIIASREDSLLVKEYYLFVNDSDRTYLGPGGDPAGGTLRFSLPPGAAGLQPTMGLMDCCILVEEDGFKDTMPMLPGSYELAFAYVVEADSDKYAINQAINYPTNRFDVLIQGEDIQVTSPQLVDDEPLEIGGITYGHLSGQGLAAGNTIAINISGLSGGNVVPTYLLVIIIIIVVAAIFIPLYLARKKRPQPVPISDTTDRQQQLIQEMAELDDSFEAGSITEDNYRKLRDAKKAELLELMQGRQEE